CVPGGFSSLGGKKCLIQSRSEVRVRVTEMKATMTARYLGRTGPVRTSFLAVAVLLLSQIMARADGGTLRFSTKSGAYRITLFTSPTSVCAGVVDFSVLVQSAESETPLLDVPVTIHAFPEGEPLRRNGGLATSAGATNKLFRAIQLELSQ